jgi:hypothetical protein
MTDFTKVDEEFRNKFVDKNFAKIIDLNGVEYIRGTAEDALSFLHEKLEEAVRDFLKEHFEEGKNYGVCLDGNDFIYTPQDSLTYTKISLTKGERE